MSASNHRNKDPNTIHHIHNQVAHQVFFFDDESKDDFLDRAIRVSKFSGLKLLGWCIMTNHFHLLIYLPPRPAEISDEEVRRRLSFLEMDEIATVSEGLTQDRGTAKDIRDRMYDIGEYMKIVKQNFTMNYNRRTGHKGTMWAGPYHDPKIEQTGVTLRHELAYINLNPIKACLTDDYYGYKWSSLAALKAGDELAREGLRFAYSYEEIQNGEPPIADSDEELVKKLEEQMDIQLEYEKRERAEAVLRKRMAGYEVKTDALTNEAMVAQAEEKMRQIQNADFQSKLAEMLKREAKDAEVQIVKAMAMAPDAKTSEIAKMVGVSESAVKRASLLLQKVGAIVREGTKRTAKWCVRV